MLLEKWDAEDLYAWGQVVGWLKTQRKVGKSGGKMMACLLRRYLVIRVLWGTKSYAGGESA